MFFLCFWDMRSTFRHQMTFIYIFLIATWILRVFEVEWYLFHAYRAMLITSNMSSDLISHHVVNLTPRLRLIPNFLRQEVKVNGNIWNWGSEKALYMQIWAIWNYFLTAISLKNAILGFWAHLRASYRLPSCDCRRINVKMIISVQEQHSMTNLYCDV